MTYLLLFLIPVIALLLWAAKVDRKRRRKSSQDRGFDLPLQGQSGAINRR